MGIGIFYSSYNNYALLEKECLEKIDFQNCKLINIDDGSTKEQQEIGKKICKKYEVPFYQNDGKGLHMATNKAIDIFLKDSSIEWVLCMQHDVKPLGANFFKSLENYLSGLDDSEIGSIGFNVIDNGKYSGSSLSVYKEEGHVKAWLGSFPLSDKRTLYEKSFIFDLIKYFLKFILRKKNIHMVHNYRRWFCPKSFRNFKEVSRKYNGLCAIDLPVWTAILINVRNWKKHIKPDKDFVFHLWFNDIAFQFMRKNIYNTVTTDHYIYNDQESKTSYGFKENSVEEAKDKNSISSAPYGNHLDIFEKKWGFSYEKVQEGYKKVQHLYKDTLIDELYNHDCTSGPLKKF